MHTEILSLPWDVVRRKRLEKNENQKLASSSLKCSRTPAVFVRDLLATHNVTILEYPRYTPDVAPADFYQFSGLKLALTGRRCCDVNDIIKNATKELKSLSQNGFQECFQHLYSPWQKYVYLYSFTKGLFWGKGSLKDWLFCISRK